MPSMSFPFKETDVVKLILEFLQNRQLNISMLNLERESGLINGVYSDDMLFLRQLILDGQWDDILQFIQPLGELESFNMKQFQYIIYRHKYLELLCIKSETGPLQDYESLIDELVKCLSMLEQLCPNKEEYNKLTLLLTLGKLSESQDYHNWNPSNARVECFKDVFKLSEKFLPLDKRDSHGERMEMSKEDRLVQLVIKGVLFESCVEFCQNKATSNEYDAKAFKLSSVLDGYGFSDADLSLLSWLQAVPPEIFTCPFEQKTFNVDVQQLQKPSLEASWSEQIMITPIKPKMFPHSAIPNRRSSDLMSRSLNPQYDGLAFGLAGGRRENLTASVDFTNSGGSMSRSFAGFHLNAPNKNMMHASIDKLFEGQNMLHTQSSSIIFEDSVSELPEPPFNSKSPPPPAKPSESTSPASNNNHHEADEVRTSSNDLYVEYQKQRMRIEEQMAEQAKRELLRQQLQEDLRVDDNRLSEESDMSKEKNLEHISTIGVISEPNEVKRENQAPVRTSEPQEWAPDPMIQAPEPQKWATDPIIQAPGPSNQAPVRYKGAPNHIIQAPDLMEETEKEDKGAEKLAEFNDEITVPVKPAPISKHISPLQDPPHTSKVPRSSPPRSKTKANRRHSEPKTSTPESSKVSPKNHPWMQTYTKKGPLKPPAKALQSFNADEPPSPVKRPPTQLTTDASSSILVIQEGMITSIAQGALISKTSKSGDNGAVEQSMKSSLGSKSVDGVKPRFIPVTTLEDQQAVRAVAFHPQGDLYAVGANSKTLRVCAFPNVTDLKEEHTTQEANVVFKRTKHHKGSIYCIGWNPMGDIIATGSNDKSIRLMRYNTETHSAVGPDMELTFHDGTVRDLVFMQDASNGSSLLISGGAGDCKVYASDCATGQPIRMMTGHSGHIYSLHTWGGCMFVSGSQDKTARVWDLRAPAAINVIPSPNPASAFASVCADPSGRLLASGHENSTVMLWDMRGNRSVQTFKPHTAEVRTVRFSMNAYYLLTGSYDQNIVLTDLHGDLMRPLPSVVVADHKDKVIQCKWHPSQLAFVSTSADRTIKTWALPVV